MKKIIFILVSSFSIINSMEQGNQFLSECAIKKDQQFKSAIINENEKKIKSLLKDYMDQSRPTLIWPNGGLNSCLNFAITNKKEKAAQLLARKLSHKIEKLENPITISFRLAGEQNNVSHLYELMQLDISPSLKNKGCDQALKAAYKNAHFPMIYQLINCYGKYIEDPIKNYGFERLVIHFPQKHSDIIETVLSHPKAIENLEEMIISYQLCNHEYEYPYRELLKQAKFIQCKK